VKALFIQCGGIVPPPLNDMKIPAHIPNQQTKNVAMETLNPSVEGESTLTFQMEGTQNFIPLINNTKGPNQSCQNQHDMPILCWASR